MTTQWLDVRAAAARLGLSKSFLDKLRSQGGGPLYSKVGSAVRYHIDELDRWMRVQTCASTSEKPAKAA